MLDEGGKDTVAMTHEFGIMAADPLPGERYDCYEPWAYDAISVHDDFIEPLMPILNEIDMFWHTLDVPGKGLAYCGITLIPPVAYPTMMEIIHPAAELQELFELVERAAKEQRYIIHFGL